MDRDKVPRIISPENNFVITEMKWVIGEMNVLILRKPGHREMLRIRVRPLDPRIRLVLQMVDKDRYRKTSKPD